jgi:hypothetical protein
MATIADLSKYISPGNLVDLEYKDLEFYVKMLNADKDNFIKTITRLGIAKSSVSSASSGGGSSASPGGSGSSASSGGGGSSASSGGGSSASSGGSKRCHGERCGGHGFITHNGCCEPCLASMEAADRAKERAAAKPSSGGGVVGSIPPPNRVIEYGIDRGMYIELPLQRNLLEAALHERQRAETIAKYGGIPGEIRYHNGPGPFGPGVHVVHHAAAGRFVQRNPGVHGGVNLLFGSAQINPNLLRF